VDHAFRHHEALARLERHRPITEVDEEATFDDIEELVLLIMLMPVLLPLYHPESHNGFVDLTKGLIVPLVSAGVDQRLDIDELLGTELNVEVGRVGIG
jgi:hypothetical protein